MILVVDNRDSFTFNLVQALQGLGASVEVRRAEQLTVDDVDALAPERILLGPGPGRPRTERDVNVEILRRHRNAVPILGVCLGHQALAFAFGAEIVQAPELVHGRAVEITHDGHGVFRDLPKPSRFGRYNSLSVRRESLPECLEVSAWSSDGDVMGLRHTSLPLEGVQFHPDSVLSPEGPALLANFLRSGR